jgi:hypothetical protein
MGWKEQARGFQLSPPLSPEEIVLKNSVPSYDDHVLRGRTATDDYGTSSSVAVRDNGCIEIFADSYTGIRIDPVYGSITFYGNTITMRGDTLNAYVRPNGIRINDDMLNLSYAYNVPTEYGTITIPGTLVPITQENAALFEKLQRSMSQLVALVPGG